MSNTQKVLVLVISILVVIIGSTAMTPSKVPTTRYMDIESYVTTNINDISPLPPSLGGTFYVTSIEAHGGAGTVSYEDGHMAYTANFTYNIDENGKPSISSFKISE